MSEHPIHEDGVYFGLDAEVYHADPALGSSNMRDLFHSPPAYWWSSVWKPLREEEDEKQTSAQLFGSALHSFVLEGEAWFHKHYWRRPEGEGILDTDADIKAWLVNRYQGSMPRLKSEKIALALGIDPDAPILEEMERRAVGSGKTPLKADDFARILLSGKMITANPDLAKAFQGGMPEVSCFWTGADGVRRKARFDYLKIRGIGDLKSCANARGIAFDQACLKAISTYRYDLQAAHYIEGREALRRFVMAGAVHGDHDAAWLRKVAGQDIYGWAWVFYQSTGAPVTWATTLTPGQNPILDIAQSHIETAVANYRRFLAEFGTETPWVLRDPMQELDINDLPAWFGRS